MDFNAAVVTGGGRQSLDRLVVQMANPMFVTRYRRVPAGRELGGHASPAILELSGPRSRYVRSWRRHARRCPICAATFRYLGLPVE